MKANRSIPGATVIPVLVYPDVRAAVAFLTAAFGFRERLQIGEDHRSQLTLGDGAVIIADETHGLEAPATEDLAHSVMVRVEDVDSHVERARAAGAVIVGEPTDLMFGERQYQVRDPWGHGWTFSESIADVAPETWGGIVR